MYPDPNDPNGYPGESYYGSQPQQPQQPQQPLTESEIIMLRYMAARHPEGGSPGFGGTDPGLPPGIAADVRGVLRGQEQAFGPYDPWRGVGYTPQHDMLSQAYYQAQQQRRPPATGSEGFGGPQTSHVQPDGGWGYADPYARDPWAGTDPDPHRRDPGRYW